jgi:4-amino-4-deoxy-L-arabinose transferase-like glycosyltransferase
MLFSHRVGLWSAALFYLTPLTSWLTGSAHTDLIVSVYVTGAVICLIRWYRSQRISWIVAAGLLIGGGVGVKLNAAYAAIGIGVAVLALMVSARQRFALQVRTATALVLTAACVALPWYVITYVHTGNPVYPMLNGIFKSPRSEPVNTMMNAAEFGIGTSGPAFLRLPFRLTLDTSRFGDALPPGTVGPMLLLFIPFGVLPLLRRTEARIVGAVAAIYFVLWAETFQYGRYYLVILPLFTVLAVGGLEMANRNRLTTFVYHTALMLLLIQQFMILPIRYWNVPERFPVDRAFGLESSDSFLARALGGYRATALINQSIRPGNKVLGMDTEYLRFYLDAPLESLAEAPVDRELRTLGDMEGSLTLARKMSELGYSYLMASHASLKNPPGYYPYAQREFLAQFARLIYSDEFVAVYRFEGLPAG